MSASPMLRRVTVIGLGLIGGSLGWALRRSGTAGEVVGVDTTGSVVERALARGLIDRGDTDVAAGVAGSEVVVIAVPVGSFGAVLEAALPGLTPGTVVTDAGSVKEPVVENAGRILGEAAPFVGGHPIAGTEDSGVEAALSDLYQGALCVLTPTADTPPWALERIGDLWRAVGAEVETMDPGAHDRVLAATSHLPHMLAYSLIQTFGALPEGDRLSRFAAGGFRDLTRIAGSDAVMWRDIALTNAGPLLEMIDRFEVQLGTLRAAVSAGDGEALEAFFREARRLRRDLPPRAPLEDADDPAGG